jgi:dimethylaniline monooxygenase (N-oxide forming)
MPSYIFPTGLIDFTPDLSRKDYERIVKGPPVYATTIIFCTGYRTRSSFLPSSCPDISNAVCRHLVAPEDPTIAYLGFLRSWVGSSGPLGEMQAMWWLTHLQGNMSRLPTSPEHYTLLTKDGRGVDFGLYMAQLAQDIGAKPGLLALLWIYGPKVLLSYCFGSSFVSFYRLVGPFKEPNAMKAIVEGELTQTIKRKGLVGNFLFGLLPMMIFGVLNGVAWLLECLRLL